ncbi:MAG TPA: hypothetical protein VN867_06665 [Candidatus Binataceae bacterium]|nr:hypothetical protein [Candidatus Binataceae bacterium]
MKIDFLRSEHGVPTSVLVESSLRLLGQLSDGKPLYIMHSVNALGVLRRPNRQMIRLEHPLNTAYRPC